MLSGMMNKAIETFIAAKLGAAGQVERVELDKKQKRIQLAILMAGESASIQVDMLGYRMEEQGGVTRLLFDEIRISRPWMEILLKEYKPDLSFRIPDSYRKALQLAL